MIEFSREKLVPVLRRGLMLAVSLGLLGAVIWMAGPRDMLLKLSQMPTRVFPILLGILFVNLLVVAFRFWRVLSHLGLSLPWSAALRASMAGNIAGLFFIPLFGQVAGRQAVLQGMGVSAVANASIAAYERAALAITSGAMAMWGAYYLLGSGEVDAFLSKLALGQVALAALCGFGLSYACGRGRFERALARSLLQPRNLLRVLEVVLVTVTGQALMLSCFVIGFHFMAPQLDWVSLLAASAMVGFAASLPISVGGWGVRELAAVYVLGLLGVPAADALVVSVVVGGCSTLVLFGAVPFLWIGKARAGLVVGQETSPSAGLSLEQSASWLLAFTALVAVFFQVHVPLAGGVSNINMADPFALLALAALALQCVQQRALPHWRMAGFNGGLALISLALVIAFLVGWREIGVSQWALGGRLTGWLVLLGYLSVGYLLIASHGNHGLRRAVETLVAVACAVIVIKVLLKWSRIFGFDPAGLRELNFQGFAGNRNAFAFQLLTVSAMLMGFSGLYARRAWSAARLRLMAVQQGVLLAGIVLTGSRAGIGAVALMLLLAWVWRLAERRFLLRSLAIAAGLWFFVTIMPPAVIQLLDWLGFDVSWLLKAMRLQSGFSTEASDGVRWKANALALKMWLEQPLLGIGMGVFIARSPAEFGFPMVIHSTPLWILAEFGVLGFGLIGWAGARMVHYALAQWPALPKDRAHQLLLLGFGVFCLVHEVLFQRIFWLVLGLLLASRQMRPKQA